MVEFSDLLGQPYKLHAVDCSTVAEEINRRLGKDVPPTTFFRAVGSEGHLGEVEEYLSEEGWKKVGDTFREATREGDLVLVDPDGKGLARGLWTLVESRSGTFLTATPAHGILAMKRSAAQGFAHSVHGVYRLP